MSLDKKMEEIEKKAKKKADKKIEKNPYQEVFESSIAKAAEAGFDKLKIAQAGLKDVTQSLEKKQDEVIDKLDQILNSDQSTRRVEVKNTQDFPRQFEINNWPDFGEVTVKNPQKEVAVTNWPEPKDFPTKDIIKGFGDKLADLPSEFVKQLKQTTQPVSVQNKNLDVFVLDPKTGKRTHPGGSSYGAASGGGMVISDIKDGTGDSIMDAANDALNVSIVSGSSAGTEFDEDTQHSTGDAGTQVLAVRDDTTPAVLSGTDGDYEPFHTDENGAVWVSLGTQLDSGQDSVTAVLSAADNAVLDNIQTAVEKIDDAIVAEDSVHSTGDSGVMALAVRNDALAALAGTDGDYAPFQVNASGALYVRDDDANTDLDTLAGAVSGNEMQVDVVAALPAGTNAIGKLAANSGVDIGDVDVTSIAAGSNTIGDVGLAARTSGGTDTFYDSDLDETKIEVTDNPNVNIYSIAAFNTTDAPLFLQLFDLDADNVTVGTTPPTNQYVIPGNADSDGSGFTLTFGIPKTYSTGFTVACTTDSEGSAAPGVGACIVDIEYKSAA